MTPWVPRGLSPPSLALSPSQLTFWVPFPYLIPLANCTACDHIPSLWWLSSGLLGNPSQGNVYLTSFQMAYVIISPEQSPVSIGGIHNRNTAADGVVRKSRRVWNNPEWTDIVFVFPESLETLFICFDDHLPIWKKKCQTKTKQNQNPTRTPNKTSNKQKTTAEQRNCSIGTNCY